MQSRKPRLIALTFALIVLSSCATLRPNPNDSEIQQTRKLAVQIFTAVEAGGVAVSGIQDMEIRSYRAGRVSDETHRTFQTDLLITARIVRSSLTNIQMATRKPELRMTIQLIIDNLNDLKTKFATSFPDIVPAIGVVTASLSVLITIIGA